MIIIGCSKGKNGDSNLSTQQPMQSTGTSNNVEIDSPSKEEIIKNLKEILEYPEIYTKILDKRNLNHKIYYESLLSNLISDYIGKSFAGIVDNLYEKSLEVINNKENIEINSNMKFYEKFFEVIEELKKEIKGKMKNKTLDETFYENKLFIKAMIARIGFNSVPSSHKSEENKKLYDEIIEDAADEYINKYIKTTNRSL